MFLKNMKWDLIVNAISKQYEIDINENEIIEFAKTITRQQFTMYYGMKDIPDETLTQFAMNSLKDEKQSREIATQAFKHKIIQKVNEIVEPVKQEISMDEFFKLMYAADDEEKVETGEDGETGETEQGYAKELTPEQIEIQREAVSKVCSQSDIVITTAKVFGKKAPLLLTKEMIQGMKSGSIIIDMAVKTGGNVEGSDPNKDILLDNGVTVIGGEGLERFVPVDASGMFSGNIYSMLEHFWDRENKAFALDTNDEIMNGCLITSNKKIIHEQFKGA
jgi:hypothetical protein